MVLSDFRALLPGRILARHSYDEVRQYVIDNNLSSQTDALIICLIWKESAFDSDARAAGSSATGLMQMTRAAAQDAGFKHSDMTDPAQNIQAGSKYLQMRIRAANGSKKAGLELYGTGPGYADDILCCEQCMLRPNSNTGGCLAIIHE